MAPKFALFTKGSKLPLNKGFKNMFEWLQSCAEPLTYAKLARNSIKPLWRYWLEMVWAAFSENILFQLCAQWTLKSACTSSRSDQSHHHPCEENMHPYLSKCGQWTFWSYYMNVQADLNLCWTHMSKGMISDVTAYTVNPRYNDSICSQRCCH